MLRLCYDVIVRVATLELMTSMLQPCSDVATLTDIADVVTLFTRCHNILHPMSRL